MKYDRGGLELGDEVELGNIFGDAFKAIKKVGKKLGKTAKKIGKSTVGKVIVPGLSLNTDPKWKRARDIVAKRIPAAQGLYKAQAVGKSLLKSKKRKALAKKLARNKRLGDTFRKIQQSGFAKETSNQLNTKSAINSLAGNYDKAGRLAAYARMF